MLRIPWHRYITMWRLVNGPEFFPEAFERLTGAGEAAIAEVERLLAQNARARAEGRGIKPPEETP